MSTFHNVNLVYALYNENKQQVWCFYCHSVILFVLQLHAVVLQIESYNKSVRMCFYLFPFLEENL